ncbi:MAG: hypothetical protein ABJK37_10500 [Paraglaciecola sp.]|uniref:hypothetical protein n=1 Tax=Paraglaciecola sp. TaxID=1920173 RepID=UPI0032988EA0
MNDEQLSPFVMSTQEGKYQVIDGNEQTWLETSSEMTAQHYIDLLNKAFKSGFKTGFRKARSG